MGFLQNLFNPKTNAPSVGTLTKDEIADLLKTSPEALEAFERAYHKECLANPDPSDMFGTSAAQAKAMARKDADPMDPALPASDIAAHIVMELLSQTTGIRIKDGQVEHFRFPEYEGTPVTPAEAKTLPLNLRPSLTGNAMKKDLNGNSYEALLFMWDKYKKETNPGRRMHWYHMFRQGLDTLDLDPVLYEMLGTNPASMGYWLPEIAKAAQGTDFFQIPDTTVVKVPLTLLQLSRLEYGGLTETDRQIVDKWAMDAFGLDEERDYFVKTGTYSSKFDFRNAHVTAGKEVTELGEYLLYIQNQAVTMAGPLTSPSIYGISTTNEWCVREYVPAEKGTPEIYKGLPLRCEIRLFADFDADEVIGISPYWEPEMMKKRFAEGADRSLHDLHDYAVYKAYEDRLSGIYALMHEPVKREFYNVIKDVNLPGQWSVDIMLSGSDHYIIDMAPAQTSALKECVPAGLLRAMDEDWMPKIG